MHSWSQSCEGSPVTCDKFFLPRRSRKHASKPASKPTSSTALFWYASGIFNWAVKTPVDWLIYGIKLPGCTGIITNHCKDPCQTVEWNVIRFYISQLSSFAKETCLLETEAQPVEPKAWQTWQSCWFSCSKFISFSAARCLAGALRSREDPPQWRPSFNPKKYHLPRSPTHFEYIAVAEWFPDFCSEAPESRTFSPKLWRRFLEPFSLKLRSSEVPDFFSEALKLRISKLQDFKASRHR